MTVEGNHDCNIERLICGINTDQIMIIARCGGFGQIWLLFGQRTLLLMLERGPREIIRAAVYN